MLNAHGWAQPGVLALVVGGAMLMAMTAGAAEKLPPQKMAPTPREKLTMLGSTEGMPLYPADPVPGFPGMDPDPAKKRLPRMTPLLVNYPGSIEHYQLENGYLPKVNPYNYRTLIRNFVAVELPGVDPALKEQFAEPMQYLVPGGGQWRDIIRTGEFAPPQSVVRLKPNGQKLSFSVGPLATSMYIVRVIAAVETPNVLEYPKNLILELKINDGPNGEVSDYVLRNRGTDNFYSTGEFFFHVVDARTFHVEFGLHSDSQIDLLVHNLDVHDVLGECAKVAGKTASIAAPDYILKSKWNMDPEEKLQPVKQGKWAEMYDAAGIDQRAAPLRAEFAGKTDAELLKIWRQRRDDAIWNNGLPLNKNMMGDEWGGLPEGIKANYPMADPDTEAMLKEKGLEPTYTAAQDLGPWRITCALPDGKTVVYTYDDLMANKPYPGLPFDAPLWGKRFEGKDGKAYFFSPLLAALQESIWSPETIRGSNYVEGGNIEAGRDAVMRLVRMAYNFPNIDPNRYFGKLVVPSVRAYQRWRRFYQYLDLPLPGEYDRLFSLVKDNQELADAVHRYIPWVETPQDVVQLLDTYCLQYGARQMAYWRQNWYDHDNAARMAEVVALQMDPKITQPWVDFIFSRTWEYPFPPAGVQDYLYTSVQRDGTTAIGSLSYAMAGGVDVAKLLQVFIKNGGDPKYDLSDPKRYPRVVTGTYFNLEGWTAGMFHPGIGDVGGYYRPYGEWLVGKATEYANVGWKWTRDPRFAYCIVNYGRRETETDQEWQEIQAAAKTTRNPFMSVRSRVLANWGGYLEGGTESDDFRFRHAARVRVGYGTGHDHADTLDLGIWSMGVPVSICGGARGDYGFPETTASISHNVVVVDRKNAQTYAWIPQMADMDKVQYLSARATYQKEFGRQTALIELDEGRSAKNPPSDPTLQKGARYDNDIVLPRAYVFDVFRVIGGQEHMYCFHGFPQDDYSLNVTPDALTDDDQQVLKDYKEPGEGLHWGGTLKDDDLVATFRLDRKGKTFTLPQYPDTTFVVHQPKGSKTVYTTEQFILGAAYDPASPRKFLRVHVLGQRGERVLTGEAVIASYEVGRTDGEFHRQVHILRKPGADNLSSMFATIWEPYAGAPVIQNIKLEGDPNNADSPVAVRVETVDGIKDLCFADASSDQLRTLADGTKVQASFAYLSQDEKGLRQVSLVGGRILETPLITVKPSTAQWEATVLDADYLNKVATLDKPFPAKLLDGQFFEVGIPASPGHDEHWTTYEAVSVKPEGNRTILEWRKGADDYAGKVTDVKVGEDSAILTVDIAPIVMFGENAQLIVTDDQMTRSWRCDITPKDDYRGKNAVGGTLTVYGAPFKEGDIKAGDRVRIFEFGKGNVWRAPSKVALRRANDGTYQLQANVACDITVAGKAEWSLDGKTWTPVAGTWQVTEQQLAVGPLYLRWAGTR